MSEIIQVRPNELWAAGCIVLALGIALGLFLSRVSVWAATRAAYRFARLADHNADLYDQAEFKIDRILRSPAYYRAQRAILRPMESVSPEFAVTTNPER